MSGAAQLEAFAGSLRRESHVLTRRPDLTWQQLHNRLYRYEAAAEGLAAERARRAGQGAPPWLWARTELRESPELIQTLVSDELGWLRACAISPDGTFVVAASEEGRDPGSYLSRASEAVLMVWDVATGAPRASLRGHTRDVWDCAVSPDSSWITSASHDGSIRIWDATTGSERAQLPGHKGTALGCTISPDGSLIASAGQGGAKVWDVASGREIASLDLANASGTIRAIAFADDGSSILVGLGVWLRVWDLSTGELRQLGSSGEDAHDSVLAACAVSPDGTWAASAGGRELRIWDLGSGACLSVLASPNDWFESCAISPDGSFVVTAGRDATARIWDPASGEKLAVLYGHESWVEDCAVSPDGTWIVSAGRDGSVRIWEVPHPVRPPQARAEEARAISGCAMSPDAAWIVCGASEPVALAEVLSEPRTALSAWGACALAPGGHVAVSHAYDAYIVWETASGRQLERLFVSTGAGATAFAIAPDASWLLGVGTDSYVLKAWGLRPPGPCGMFKAGTDPASGYAFSHTGAGISDCCVGPDGRWVVSADAGESLRIWDTDGGDTPPGAPTGMGGHVCAASPDGGWIVSGRHDGGLSVGEFGTGRRPQELRGHGDVVIACAVTPDAALILSAGHDRALRVWDRATGAEVAALFLPTGIEAVAAHPWKPWAACSTALGDVFVELMGLEYGPLVVTARGPDRLVRCPACATVQPVRDEELGAVRFCEGPGCSLLLRVNRLLMREGPPRGLFSDEDDEIRREWYDKP